VESALQQRQFAIDRRIIRGPLSLFDVAPDIVRRNLRGTDGTEERLQMIFPPASDKFQTSV
jgi:hypothetical protein